MRTLKHRNTRLVVGTGGVMLAGLYLSGFTPLTIAATAAWAVVAAIAVRQAARS